MNLLPKIIISIVFALLVVWVSTIRVASGIGPIYNLDAQDKFWHDYKQVKHESSGLFEPCGFSQSDYGSPAPVIRSSYAGCSDHTEYLAFNSLNLFFNFMIYFLVSFIALSLFTLKRPHHTST